MDKRKILLTVLLIIGIILLILNIITLNLNDLDREAYLSLASNLLIIITAVLGFKIKFEPK